MRSWIYVSSALCFSASLATLASASGCSSADPAAEGATDEARATSAELTMAREAIAVLSGSDAH